jgi:hypothetical protein
MPICHFHTKIVASSIVLKFSRAGGIHCFWRRGIQTFLQVGRFMAHARPHCCHETLDELLFPVTTCGMCKKTLHVKCVRSYDRPPGFLPEAAAAAAGRADVASMTQTLLHGAVICWRCTSKDVVCFMQNGLRTRWQLASLTPYPPVYPVELSESQVPPGAKKKKKKDPWFSYLSSVAITGNRFSSMSPVQLSLMCS